MTSCWIRAASWGITTASSSREMSRWKASSTGASSLCIQIGSRASLFPGRFASILDATCVMRFLSNLNYLVTLPYVDENRIGVLGICGGGAYAINAAMTERRIKG